MALSVQGNFRPEPPEQRSRSIPGHSRGLQFHSRAQLSGACAEPGLCWEGEAGSGPEGSVGLTLSVPSPSGSIFGALFHHSVTQKFVPAAAWMKGISWERPAVNHCSHLQQLRAQNVFHKTLKPREFQTLTFAPLLQSLHLEMQRSLSSSCVPSILKRIQHVELLCVSQNPRIPALGKAPKVMESSL